MVIIKDNTSQLALVNALGRPGTTVYLAPNVDMDFSTFRKPGDNPDEPLKPIDVANGVTLMGGKPCDGGGIAYTAPGQDPFVTSICGGRTSNFPGPRIFVDPEKVKPYKPRAEPLFRIACEAKTPANVGFTGFRIEGPQRDPVDGDGNKEVGIRIEGCRGVEIDNMELSAWSGAAIRIYNYNEQSRNGQPVMDGQPIIERPEDIRIHDNFIHHKQHVGSEGYGVDVSWGAWALIERNVFDFNRHAVTAGTVKGYTWQGGWTARQNLVLKGGGWHGTFPSQYTPFMGPFQQQFDVHGDRNCSYGWPESWWADHLWNCGRSGVLYDISNNAFQYTNTNAFKLRGTPLTGAFVHGNVFAHKNINDAATTDGHGTIGLNIGANTPNRDTFGQYGACDFDGDGTDDLFLATGNSWWYMSSAKDV